MSHCEYRDHIRLELTTAAKALWLGNRRDDESSGPGQNSRTTDEERRLRTHRVQNDIGNF
jgi:hypothetical protein